MTFTMDLERRKPVWEAISDLWVDTEPNISWIAQVLINSNYTIQELEDIYAFEVSPVVYQNFGSVCWINPVPPVWEGFNSDWLVEAILNNIKQQNQSVWHRVYIRSKFNTWARTYIISSDWKEIVSIIESHKI